MKIESVKSLTGVKREGLTNPEETTSSFRKIVWRIETARKIVQVLSFLLFVAVLSGLGPFPIVARARAYNPNEKVVVGGQKITLARYASRMNIRLLRPAEFNSKLRERRVDKKVTVQKVCRVSKNEKDVRVVLDEMWQKPSKSQAILDEALYRNRNVFEFEKVLTS